MKSRNVILILILSLLLFAILILSIGMGAVRISVKDTVSAVFNPESVKTTTVYIIRNLRLPRALLAVFAGCILALSGLVFQCVFKNPMADSYILGISSGASCAVALGLLLGVSLSSNASLPLFAFAGSMLTAVFLFSTNSKDHNALLLSGIAVNFFLSAMTTLFVDLGHGTVDAILYWTMGSLSNANYTRVIVTGILTILLLVTVEKNSGAMDILLIDESTAISSGVNVKRKRYFLLFTASTATAIIVGYCGVIGFVGLMSPHIARVLCGPVHKRLAPVSMLFGAVILLLSDLISKTVIAPGELPVGIVTSILGAPLFFILLKRKKSWLKQMQ